jgi:hypothetical protein
VLTKDGLSVMICKAFELVWNTGAKLGGTLAFEGAVRCSLGLLGLLTIDLGNTGRASAGFGGAIGDAGFGGSIGRASSRKLTHHFHFALCCNLAFR